MNSDQQFLPGSIIYGVEYTVVKMNLYEKNHSISVHVALVYAL